MKYTIHRVNRHYNHYIETYDWKNTIFLLLRECKFKAYRMIKNVKGPT